MTRQHDHDVRPLVADPSRIRLAMLGMVDGNGHPYSWSAIINGRFDAHVMAQCGYPVIPQYLAANRDALGIDGAQVTHVWCDDPADAQRVAEAAHIPHVAQNATDVIGQVDAVVIATDKGHEHVERARPFIEAGLPVFIDKPLTDNEADLKQFIAWHDAGKPLMSTSCMRYAPEFAGLRARIHAVGEPRLIIHAMLKSWDRYGIHALEGVYPFLAPGGWTSVSHSGDDKQCVVHVRHDSGVEVVLPVIEDMVGGYAHLSVYGTKGMLHARAADTFTAFKAQLVAFVDYLRSGALPFDFAQTVELMTIIIAGIRSREQGGGTVALSRIDVSC
jgi:predicted dehydrogenase